MIVKYNPTTIMEATVLNCERIWLGAAARTDEDG